MMNKILFFIGFVSIFFLPNIYGQELFPVRNFEPETYQGETQNWGICQTDNHFIYIANNKGLLEFNGASWNLYPSPNHTIMRSANALGNRIYTGCFLEFGYWERDAFSNLTYVSLSEKIKDKLSDDEDFWNIVFYQHHILFQSLSRIYIYDSRNDGFQIITSDNYLPKLFKVGEQMYFQQMNEGLFQFEDGKPSLISDDPVVKENIIINLFHVDNKLLMQTQEKGFYVLENGHVSAWKIEAASILNSLSVYSCRQLQDESFVLGTIGEGVYILSPEGQITSHLDMKNGLQNNTVLSVFEDADNNIWLGLDNGISVLNYTSPFKMYYDAEGVFGTVYASACHQGYLYLGTNQGLFYKPLGSSNKFQFMNGTKGQVWMMKVIDNTLFCGHNVGTFVVNGDKATLICNELGTWDIKQIDGFPHLLLQGNHGGLNILEQVDGKWQHRNKIEGFNISSRYFEMLEGQIFVNHEYKGVYRLNISNDFTTITQVEKIPSAPLGPNSGLVKHNNRLIYFTKEGIFEYDQKAQFTKNEQLTKLIFDDDVYLSGKMVLDEDQTLWIFTQNNISAILPGKLNAELNIHRVALPLSLRETVVGYENLLHMGNDQYLLGTTNGYLLFNLSRIQYKKYAIQINSIDKTANGQRLKAKNNHIAFQYSVPVYYKFTPVKYQYKLEGLDKDWSDWTNESVQEYTSLAPGSYLFQARAKVGNQLTTNTASYHFSVSKPWYASWWMLLVYFLLAGGVLMLINRWYRIRYDKKAEQINQEKLLLQLTNEKETIRLKNENLNNEVESVNRELASSTLAIVKKNELLKTIRLKLQQGGTTSIANNDAALQIIDENLDRDSDWEAFQEVFNNTDRDFLKKLKELHPSLTPNDLKLCVYLRLNLSSKEIAPLLYISPQSVEVKRSRLRKKLDLNHGENLTEYILGL